MVEDGERGTSAKHSYAGKRYLSSSIASCGLYANTKRARDKGEETKLDVKQ